MRATLLHATRDIRLEEVDDPRVHHATDAVVRVSATCVCGSDLHPYRAHPGPATPKRAGHEFLGVVEAVGSDVGGLAEGDWVVAPFAISDGTCVHCRHGITTSCVQGSFWGAPDRTGVLADGAQADLVRVPLAASTLVRLPQEPAPELVPDLLALSDVMGTGHHAAVSAGVVAGCSAVVVGDGAVGLCAVLAASRLGAGRIIALSRQPRRQELARAFGATDVVAARGAEAVEAVMDLLDGVGADAVMECVGSQESMDTAAAAARPGGRVGLVGAPSGTLPAAALFGRDVAFAGGVAPVRTYLPELLADVLAGSLRPGRVFDAQMPLAEVARAYAAMDERSAIKVLLTP